MPHLNTIKSFTCFSPGRVCLFGEHQDYLGMPRQIISILYASEFLDLTHPGNIEFVKEKLSQL
jgi:hypothetical protein